MIKDIVSFKHINPQLVKSLQRYILISVFIVSFILFSSQLYYLDSYRYFSDSNDNVMINELNSIDMITYNDASISLSKTVNLLSDMGTDIEYHEVVLSTSFKFLNTDQYMYYDAFISENDNLLDLMTNGLTWAFKRELSPHGIYVSKTAYEQLGSKNTVEIEIDDSSDMIEVVIDGVYDYSSPNFVFYSYGDRGSFDKVLLNKKILETVTVTGKMPADEVIQTENPITIKDLKHFDLVFDQPMTGLQNYYDSVYIIKNLLDKLNELVWLVSGTLIILSFIMLYRYLVELKYVLRTYYLFYASKKETLLMQILSGFLVILKPFLIPIVLFTVLSGIVYALYGYFVLNFAYTFLLLALFIVFILIFSFVQSISNFSKN